MSSFGLSGTCLYLFKVCYFVGKGYLSNPLHFSRYRLLFPVLTLESYFRTFLNCTFIKVVTFSVVGYFCLLVTLVFVGLSLQSFCMVFFPVPIWGFIPILIRPILAYIRFIELSDTFVPLQSYKSNTKDYFIIHWYSISYVLIWKKCNILCKFFLKSVVYIKSLLYLCNSSLTYYFDLSGFPLVKSLYRLQSFSRIWYTLKKYRGLIQEYTSKHKSK